MGIPSVIFVPSDWQCSVVTTDSDEESSSGNDETHSSAARRGASRPRATNQCIYLDSDISPRHEMIRCSQSKMLGSDVPMRLPRRTHEEGEVELPGLKKLKNAEEIQGVSKSGHRGTSALEGYIRIPTKRRQRRSLQERDANTVVKPIRIGQRCLHEARDVDNDRPPTMPRRNSA